MRVLWVDADQNPWTDASGWEVIKSFGVEVRRISTSAEAYNIIIEKDFDLVLVRAEIHGAVDLMVHARKQINTTKRKMILASSEWNKEQFRAHSRTEGAAHRYARVPMPPEGFIKLLSELFECPVENMREFSVSGAIPSASKLEKFAKMKKPSSQAIADAEDVDVLRKYLHIKEEQLEIAESERDELVMENERIQREAHQLQVRLREFEHQHDELTKKLAQMLDEKETQEREFLLEKESFEQSEKEYSEKVRALESKVSEANEKYENLRVRVRKDIRKIRANEKDLEARLELLRKDSQTLLHARDEKVLEQQRKIDALEFDLDQVQDSRVQAEMEAERYLAKLSRVARALNIAVNMIEEEPAKEEELEDMLPEMGGAGNAEEPAPDLEHAHSVASIANPEAQAQPTPEAQSQPESLALAAGAENLSVDLDALAKDGEPTQMISGDALEKIQNEPESSSG